MKISALLSLLLVSLANPAFAVFSGDMSPRARSSDTDYAAGIEAFDKQNWQGVISAMTKVVARRPHHDNAWARLGYAHRKLGQFDKALAAYSRALERNPHNRSALEYLGKANLELGRTQDAQIMLDRLAAECKRVALTFSDGDFSDGCDEWRDLKEAIDKAQTR